ncbi:putative lipid II flippase FtsW [Kocuria sp. cx-116]|uniref:putative lipid II flippase FtsW n=1 Tax=Kocuria sp. cx-116 TaxID=2771378 RepID=UPI001CC25786|nr:putative lipid II flippase FtsW [Kocuria sp. cx-116]
MAKLPGRGSDTPRNAAVVEHLVATPARGTRDARPGMREDDPGVERAGNGGDRPLTTKLRHLWHQLVGGPLYHSYWALAGAVLMLTAIGMMMVLSASAVEAIAENSSAYFLFQRQAMFGVAGLIAMIGLSFVPAWIYRKFSWGLWGLGVVLLLLVFTPIGQEVNGNRNWLNLGGMTLQPSEAAKLALCVWLAAQFAKQGDEIRDWKKALLPSALGFLVPTGLVAAGGDMGTAIVFVLIYAAALFFAGAPLKIFAGAAVLGAVLGVGAIITAPHRIDRITGWLFGECGATDACWQAQQGLNALATGGWWGVGLGQSRLKYNYVPEAHNDYIFSIIGEELGLLGTAIILLFFAIIVIAMARIILRTRSIFVKITTACVATWLVGQAFVNLGMVTGLLPVIGIPLPFISYGGSALLISLMAVGVVMSFARVPRSVEVGMNAAILDRQEAHEAADDHKPRRRGPDWLRRMTSQGGKAHHDQ